MDLKDLKGFDPSDVEDEPMVSIGDICFMTMGEACRYVMDHGTPAFGEAMTLHRLGGASINSSYLVREDDAHTCSYVSMVTEWSEAQYRRLERETSHLINTSTYLRAGGEGTPDVIAEEYRGQWASGVWWSDWVEDLFETALYHHTSLGDDMVGYLSHTLDADWLAMPEATCRGIETAMWDDLASHYGDTSLWNPLGDMVELGWDAAYRGVSKAVEDVCAIVRAVERERGGYSDEYRDCL